MMNHPQNFPRTASSMMMSRSQNFQPSTRSHFQGRSPAATRSHMMMDSGHFDHPAATRSQMSPYDYPYHPAMTQSDFPHEIFNARSTSPGPFTATRSRFDAMPSTHSLFPEPVFSPNRRF
jgi:hypothetical protein